MSVLEQLPAFLQVRVPLRVCDFILLSMYGEWVGYVGFGGVDLGWGGCACGVPFMASV